MVVTKTVTTSVVRSGQSDSPVPPQQQDSFYNSSGYPPSHEYDPQYSPNHPNNQAYSPRQNHYDDSSAQYDDSNRYDDSNQNPQYNELNQYPSNEYNESNRYDDDSNRYSPNQIGGDSQRRYNDDSTFVNGGGVGIDTSGVRVEMSGAAGGYTQGYGGDAPHHPPSPPVSEHAYHSLRYGDGDRSAGGGDMTGHYERLSDAVSRDNDPDGGAYAR